MEEKKDELFDKFTKELFKMEPINFIGLAKIFGVPISNDGETTLRPTVEIITDILNGFNKISNKKKKEILKLCKQVNRGDKNGNRTKKPSKQNPDNTDM